MLCDLSPDQEMLRATTARYLARVSPVAELRRLRDDPAGFDPDYWRRGAELGWTSLLVPEERGGGSVSGAGLVDLSTVAFEFGRAAAPGPLTPANVVAGALGTAGDDHAVALAQVLDGSAIATWCVTEGPPRSGGGTAAVTIDLDGDDVVVRGIKRSVESAGQASYLLVTGATGTGVSQVLVPAGTPGLTIAPMRSVDQTRRFSVVTFDGVRVPRSALVGDAGAAAPDVARQRLVAIVLTTAESVGAMQAAFDLTVEWAFDRYTFGRPLASYQALKHRFADMKAWLEASHAISDEAAAAVAAGAPEAAELSSAAKAFVGTFGSELVQECIQLHGGIGVTYEHDLHLFVRRHTADRALFGTPAEHRRLLADLAIRAGTAA